MYSGRNTDLFSRYGVRTSNLNRSIKFYIIITYYSYIMEKKKKKKLKLTYFSSIENSLFASTKNTLLSQQYFGSPTETISSFIFYRGPLASLPWTVCFSLPAPVPAPVLVPFFCFFSFSLSLYFCWHFLSFNTFSREI